MTVCVQQIQTCPRRIAVHSEDIKFKGLLSVGSFHRTFHPPISINNQPGVPVLLLSVVMHAYYGNLGVQGHCCSELRKTAGFRNLEVLRKSTSFCSKVDDFE